MEEYELPLEVLDLLVKEFHSPMGQLHLSPAKILQKIYSSKDYFLVHLIIYFYALNKDNPTKKPVIYDKNRKRIDIVGYVEEQIGTGRLCSAGHE